MLLSGMQCSFVCVIAIMTSFVSFPYHHPTCNFTAKDNTPCACHSWVYLHSTKWVLTQRILLECICIGYMGAAALAIFFHSLSTQFATSFGHTHFSTSFGHLLCQQVLNCQSQCLHSPSPHTYYGWFMEATYRHWWC